METEKLFNIDKLSNEEVDQLSEKLGIQVRDLVDEASDKINNLLKTYGLEAKMEVVINGSYKLAKPKKKRSKSARQS